MKMNKFLCLTAVLLVFVACDEPIETPEPGPGRGKVVSVTLIQSFSRDQVDSIKNDILPFIFAASIDPLYGADVYKVLYGTVDAAGHAVVASGGLCIPQGSLSDAPLVSYQHGTITQKEAVPSRGFPRSYESFVGLILAGDGMVVSMPDYLGLGDSEGLHPYVHAETEANTALDLLRAARTIGQDQALSLNKELFLVGYSQGGHATMALTKSIEENHAGEFTLTASAPMAGPYDLSGIMSDRLMSDDPYGSPSYLPFLMLGYNAVYNLYPGPADFLAAPYASTIPPLFDGSYSTGDINAALPNVPKQILRPEVLQAFQTDPNHPFRVRLRENDLYDWTPQTPMRLYHCLADELVPYVNSQLALTTFQNRGATQVLLFTPDNLEGLDFGHADCAGPSLLGAREWFLQLVQ